MRSTRASAANTNRAADRALAITSIPPVHVTLKAISLPPLPHLLRVPGTLPAILQESA
jgi:hypothetical protein